MAQITITLNTENPAEIMRLKTALQSIAEHFNKDNLLYIADLSKKKNVNEKFESLKSNPFIKTLI